MNFKCLKLDLNDKGIGTILFSNTRSKNALTPKMISEIILALKFLEKSENCRILVISGEGNIFSSGADLEWMKKSINLKYKENVKESKEFTKMLKVLTLSLSLQYLW